MRVNENGQYVSDDGFWVWDGAAWIPADGSAAPASTDATATQASETTETTDSAAEAVAPAAETVPEPAASYEPEATQEYTAVDYASDSTAAETFSGSDDSGSLQADDRVVPHVDNQHPMSPDGRHWWDGEKWIDVSTDATSLHTAGLAADAEQAEVAGQSTGWQGTDQEVPLADTSAVSSYSEPEADTGVSPVQAVQATAPAQPERQLSPDGMWEWNGSQWVPAEQQAASEPEPEPEAEPAKPERQLSPDGHWEWDGTSWVPARKDDVAPVPAGAHVSPDGHWWWDGSQWLPTGR
jgi:hypothetical protein